MPPKKSQPKSSSPGEDLFILEYFTKYQKVSRQEAQLLWARQSAQTQAKYEEQAKNNLRDYKRKRENPDPRASKKKKSGQEDSEEDSGQEELENPYEIS